MHDQTEVPKMKNLGFAVAPGAHTLVGVKKYNVTNYVYIINMMPILEYSKLIDTYHCLRYDKYSRIDVVREEVWLAGWFKMISYCATGAQRENPSTHMVMSSYDDNLAR